MSRPDDRWIDFVLGELPADEAEALAAHADADSKGRVYGDAVSLLRDAAAEGWTEAPRRRGLVRLVRPALAAAALLLAAVGLFFMNGTPRNDRVVFVPDVAFGYLLPEEVDAHGAVARPASGDGFFVRTGALEVSALGSEREYRVGAGDSIRAGSELRVLADSSVRIDLPGRGIAFLKELTTVQVRLRDDGRAALRLVHGEMCTVTGDLPLHIAVEGTDLLLEQGSGAALVRETPAEAICLRGDLALVLSPTERFVIPAAERLPAACAKAPITAPATIDDLQLDWYRALVYKRSEWAAVPWERPGVSRPIAAADDALLYLRFFAAEGATLTIRYGGEPHEYALHKACPLALRLRLADLGPGPHLEITPADGLIEARVFSATPR